MSSDQLPRSSHYLFESRPEETEKPISCSDPVALHAQTQPATKPAQTGNSLDRPIMMHADSNTHGLISSPKRKHHELCSSSSSLDLTRSHKKVPSLKHGFLSSSADISPVSANVIHPSVCSSNSTGSNAVQSDALEGISPSTPAPGPTYSKRRDSQIMRNNSSVSTCSTITESHSDLGLVVLAAAAIGEAAKSNNQTSKNNTQSGRKVSFTSVLSDTPPVSTTLRNVSQNFMSQQKPIINFTTGGAMLHGQTPGQKYSQDTQMAVGNAYIYQAGPKVLASTAIQSGAIPGQMPTSTMRPFMFTQHFKDSLFEEYWSDYFGISVYNANGRQYLLCVSPSNYREDSAQVTTSSQEPLTYLPYLTKILMNSSF